MSKGRIIRGLSYAARCPRPSSIPVGRPRGAKAAGIRYERALAKALPSGFEHGPWFTFRDINGSGYCQPDFLLVLNNLAVILECKYSWTMAAWGQMELLYVPVLKLALQRPVIGIQLCKRLIPEASAGCKIVSNLGNGMIVANSGERVALHWLENTPIALMPSADQIKAMETRRELTNAHA